MSKSQTVWRMTNGEAYRGVPYTPEEITTLIATLMFRSDAPAWLAVQMLGQLLDEIADLKTKLNASWNPVAQSPIPRNRWIWLLSSKPTRTQRVSAYRFDPSHNGWWSGMGWWSDEQIDQFFSHWAEMGQPPIPPETPEA